jgi:hypothetical protein
LLTTLTAFDVVRPWDDTVKVVEPCLVPVRRHGAAIDATDGSLLVHDAEALTSCDDPSDIEAVTV